MAPSIPIDDPLTSSGSNSPAMVPSKASSHNNYADTRLVASDLDGTLLFTIYPHTVVPPRAIAVFSRLTQLNIPIVLASGRPPRAMIPVVEQAGIPGISLCCNGAIVYDVAKRQVIKKYSMATSAVLEMMERCRSAFGDKVCFGIESGVDFRCDAGYAQVRRDFLNHPHQVVQDPKQLIEETVTVNGTTQQIEHSVEKFIVLHKELDGETLYNLLLALFPAKVWSRLVKITFSNPWFVEISATGVCKGTSLAAVCQELGILSSQVIAFGDMPNDVEMLQFAGRSVGVANAHADVLAIVDEVTGENTEDGVAQVLEKVVDAIEHKRTHGTTAVASTPIVTKVVGGIQE
ncbi:hypothetical protein BZG36_05399 [Bifiguratus adelaidae]|uniref:Uncharacterized protein n=1 Tax=Bifiguratus adelaidae TaxID=1938954 RepID=A0A261XT98_9FUNG|nr:hypothetical protein BZG36_05399 [Bifiguratus adelaidae]